MANSDSSPAEQRPSIGTNLLARHASLKPVIRAAVDDPATPSDLNSLVMAWACDRDTGEPTYILALGADRKGAQCRCNCASCEQPLVAVNAATEVFQKRPHFRHPPGSESKDCMVVAARLAVLKALQQQGEILLPQRRMGAKVEGVTGKLHEGWVSAPARTFRISEMRFQDRTAALLVLSDGVELRVLLTGTSAADGDGAVVFLDVAHIEELAGLRPEELQRRLNLVPPDFSWCRHWHDAELEVQARAQAIAEADKELDWASEGDAQFVGMDPAAKRETILHLEVKNILAQARYLNVPALVLAPVTAIANGERHLGRLLLAAQQLRVQDAVLEKRFSAVRPDVTCQVWPLDEGNAHPADEVGRKTHTRGTQPTTLFIEVTVTNGIDQERQARIEDAGHATLEIDLRRTGGRVTREELRVLVLNDLALKRWVFHPQLRHAAQIRARALARDADNLARPFQEVASDYLQAVERCLSLGELSRKEAEEAGVLIYEDELNEASDAMRVHGYPEASDVEMWGSHRILDRLLSIQADRGIGYNLSSGFQVLNAIRQSRGAARKDWTIYLIAARAWLLDKLNPRQIDWLNEWRTEVIDAIKPPESDRQSVDAADWWPDAELMRNVKYDRILSVLFPELCKGLASKWGKSDEYAIDLHRENRNGWLKGNALEKWKRDNPQAASAWQAGMIKKNQT